MLDLVFEELRYKIESEWPEGQIVAKILETFEDVKIESPGKLTEAEKEDELRVAIWTEDVKLHVAELRAVARAKKKLYAAIWNMLSKVMKNKIAGQDGYSIRSESGDVVWLVKVIRDLITNFDDAMPKVLSTCDALERIMTFRQNEKLENADYVKNLLALIKVFEQYCGPYGVYPKQLTEIERQAQSAVDENGDPLPAVLKSELKASEIRKIREKAIAILILKNADKRRYSGLKKNLATDYGLKVDKYPDTIDGAINALNVHESHLAPAHLRKGRFHGGYNFAQLDGEVQQVPGSNGKIAEGIKCHKCKHVGHYANKCPTRDTKKDGPDDEKEQES